MTHSAQRCYSVASCSAAGHTLYRAAKRRNVVVHVYSHALGVALQPGGEAAVHWCDTCFPPLNGGTRVSFEYIEQVTGWSRSQLNSLSDAVTSHLPKPISRVGCLEGIQINLSRPSDGVHREQENTDTHLRRDRQVAIVTANRRSARRDQTSTRFTSPPFASDRCIRVSDPRPRVRSAGA